MRGYTSKLVAWLVAGVGTLACASEECAPINEPDAPEGNSLHITFPGYMFVPGAWRVDVEGDGVDVQCEIELGQDGQQPTCSDGLQLTSFGERIENVHLTGYAPRNVTVSLWHAGTLEADQEFSPAYDDMGHCSTAVHAVVEFIER